MGWLKALRNNTGLTGSEQHPPLCNAGLYPKTDAREISHIEDISASSTAQPEKPNVIPFAPLRTTDAELPLVPAAHITSKSQRCNEDLGERLYLVVDNIVYDCTDFMHEHPGGQRVIQSFKGQDCSWQFWRFHSKDTMADWGRPLRVARTEGVPNKWKERPRFVGLRRFGAEGDEGW
jgi:cytochrome b involved in lipid metabolism